jgi:hypothetical protein
MEDKTLIENDKLSLGDHVDHINMKQIDEFLPLITEKSFNLKLLVPPVVSHPIFRSNLCQYFRIFLCRVHIQLILVQMWIYSNVNLIQNFYYER